MVCCVVFLYLGAYSPHVGTTLETTLSPLSFSKSFMKIRSAVPENVCLVFCGKRKKQKKTSVKHIRIRLIGGCVNDEKKLASMAAVPLHTELIMTSVQRCSLS